MPTGSFGFSSSGGARLALHVLVHHRHVVAARIGRLAGEHLVQDHADGVDVGALVHLAARICSGAMYLGEPMT